MTEQIKYIPARLKSAVKGGHVTGAEDIDAGDGKTQQQVNTELDAQITATQKQNVIAVDELPLPIKADPKSIYRVVGETSYTDYMVNATGDDWKELAEYSFPGTDDEPTVESDNLVKSGGVYEALLKCSETIVSTITSQNGVKFPISLKANHKYYIQYVSGEYPNIYTGNAQDQQYIDPVGYTFWEEYNTISGGELVAYVPNVSNPPVLRIADSDSLVEDLINLKELINSNESDIQENANAINILNEKTIITMSATQETNSWKYNFKVQQGVSYYVKHISGQGGNFYTGYGQDAVNLITGKWVKFTAATTAFPETYGTYGTMPVVEIVDESSELFKEFSSIEVEIQNSKIKYTTLICNRDGNPVNNDATHFYGLQAITTAINSITDASYYNRYIIKIIGHFLFTDPNDITLNFSNDGYAPIISKSWVSIEGIDKKQSSVEVRFDEDTIFPSGKSYNNYQPVYVDWLMGDFEIRNLTLIEQNCRYVFHIETNSPAYPGVKLIVEDCDLINMGNSVGGIGNIFGTGGGIQFDWIIKNCKLFAKNAGVYNFAYHSYIGTVADKSVLKSTIVFDSCDFNADIFGWDLYQYNRKDTFIFKNTNLNKIVAGGFSPKESNRTKLGSIQEVITDFGSIPFGIDIQNGKSLKIVANIVGDITINESSSAFGIIGDVSDAERYETDWGAVYEFGYEHKQSISIAGGYALGYVNVGNGTTGLAGILGDCSSESKSLSLTIGSNNISIIFDEDFTGKTNDYILSIINSALGAYGTASLDTPEKYMFPLFNGVQKGLINNTNSGEIIRKGMGVIITSNSTVRLARRSDGYIDGVALDEILPYQKGRVITKGMINVSEQDNNNYTCNNIYPYISGLNNGDLLSIDENNDGQFVKSNAAPVIRVSCGYGKLL